MTDELNLPPMRWLVCCPRVHAALRTTWAAAYPDSLLPWRMDQGLVEAVSMDALPQRLAALPAPSRAQLQVVLAEAEPGAWQRVALALGGADPDARILAWHDDARRVLACLNWPDPAWLRAWRRVVEAPPEEPTDADPPGLAGPVAAVAATGPALLRLRRALAHWLERQTQARGAEGLAQEWPSRPWRRHEFVPEGRGADGVFRWVHRRHPLLACALTADGPRPEGLLADVPHDLNETPAPARRLAAWPLRIDLSPAAANADGGALPVAPPQLARARAATTAAGSGRLLELKARLGEALLTVVLDIPERPSDEAALRVAAPATVDALPGQIRLCWRTATGLSGATASLGPLRWERESHQVWAMAFTPLQPAMHALLIRPNWPRFWLETEP